MKEPWGPRLSLPPEEKQNQAAVKAHTAYINSNHFLRAVTLMQRVDACSGAINVQIKQAVIKSER